MILEGETAKDVTLLVQLFGKNLLFKPLLVHLGARQLLLRLEQLVLHGPQLRLKPRTDTLEGARTKNESIDSVLEFLTGSYYTNISIYPTVTLGICIPICIST